MTSWHQLGPGHTEEARARFPAIGFDPCPGDQRAAEHVAGVVRRAARSLDEISQVLNGRGDGEWRGKAAEEFRRQFNDDFRPKIDKARDSFARSAAALEEWAAYMPPQQLQARALEDEAGAAKSRAENAKTHLAGLPPEPEWHDVPTNDREEREAKQDAKDRSRAETAVSNAESALEQIRERAARLADRYRSQGEDIAERLKRAMDIAPNEPGLFDKIGEAIGAAVGSLTELVDGVLEDITAMLEELAPLLSFISTLAGITGTLLGLLSLIPGLQFLAAPALILGGVALLTSYLAAVGTTGSFLQALKDPTVIINAVTLALGLGAFGAGLKLMRVAGVSKSYSQLIANASRIKPGLPSYPSYFRLVLAGGRTRSLTEFGWQMTRFTTTWQSNAMGLFPGGTFEAFTDTRDWLLYGGDRPTQFFPDKDVRRSADALQEGVGTAMEEATEVSNPLVQPLRRPPIGME
ncbi:cell envelope integrity protein TolA [Streptomyces sp. WMMC500]|uniref:cell envelope integrity protein TolA n=1 Tax=Streptomyces sp. WMMC500 TaxID=3015154 RepID=UPI00248C6203|nr:cell envelope integrity protein TolA [Streptomyces sp. WMMC500]WBB64292.1 cell envelope integrity protein TolA [Streptomyces sp. WMMC500]